MRLRARDPEAVGVLYDRYGKAAYSLALRILRDPNAAESVVAEAMLKCWNRVATFRETRGSALGVWFLALTYSDALEHLGRDGTRPLESGVIFQDWSKCVDADRVQETHVGLRKLDAEEKQFLELAFFEGFPPAELAARSGRSRTEVDNVIQSALTKLAL